MSILMAKLNKISILNAARLLGWQPTSKLTPQQQLLLAEQYLQQFDLTQVELDPAFVNPDGSINNYALKETQIRNILKDKENNE